MALNPCNNKGEIWYIEGSTIGKTLRRCECLYPTKLFPHSYSTFKCRGEYKDSRSREMKRFRGQNPCSHFKGCQKVENILSEAREAILRPVLEDKFTRLDPHLVLDIELSPLSCRTDFFDTLDPIKWKINWAWAHHFQRMEDLICETKEAVLRRLLWAGAFDHDDVLKITAFCVFHNMKTKDEIHAVFENYPFEEFASHQSQIYLKIRKHTDPRLFKIKEALKTLSKKQFEAIQLVYYKNRKGMTKVDIAKRLGISIDSLKDRLNAAYTKIWKELHE